MNIHFTIDGNDYSEWAIHYSRTNRKQNRWHRWVRIGALFIVFVLASLLWSRGDYGPVWMMFVCCVFAVALRIFLPLLTPQLVRNQMKKHFANPENAKHLGRRTLSIDEEGLISITDNHTVLYQWKAIEGIDVTPGYAYVRIGTVASEVIPQAKVEDGNFDAFVEEARRLQALAATAQTPVRLPAR